MLLPALFLLLQATASPPAASAATPSVGVQDTALERRTREVASELRCPVCQGLSIADSPSELAQEMKGLVRDQLASGKTPDDVKRYFIDKYGEWILLAPKPTGANLSVYLLPIALVLGGLVLIARVVRRWSSAPGGAPPSGAAEG